MFLPDLCAVVVVRERFVLRAAWDLQCVQAGDICVMPRWRALRLVRAGHGWLVPRVAREPFFRIEMSMDILTLLTPPESEPISVPDAKLYLRIDDAHEDALVGELIAAAREAVERATGRSLLPQQWRWESAGVVEELLLPLPRGPVSAIDNVTALKADGEEQLVALLDYQLLAGDRLLLKRLPSHRAIRIEYQAGYASVQLVPAPLVQAVRMLTAYLYDARETQLPQLPPSVSAMIAPFRLIRI